MYLYEKWLLYPLLFIFHISVRLTGGGWAETRGEAGEVGFHGRESPGRDKGGKHSGKRFSNGRMRASVLTRALEPCDTRACFTTGLSFTHFFCQGEDEMQVIADHLVENKY